MARTALMQGTQIATAIALEANTLARYRGTVERQRRLRAPLVAIDRIIERLEVRHLAGRTVIDNHVCRQLAHLSVLVPLTDDVSRASDTRVLHAALLDLQEQVLETVRPSGHVYARHDEAR
jgi:predicted metallo-beta-lactamase superfamily hydrolase